MWHYVLCIIVNVVQILAYLIKALQILAYLTFTISLWCMSCKYSHFSDEELESQRGQVICPHKEVAELLLESRSCGSNTHDLNHWAISPMSSFIFRSPVPSDLNQEVGKGSLSKCCQTPFVGRQPPGVVRRKMRRAPGSGHCPCQARHEHILKWVALLLLMKCTSPHPTQPSLPGQASSFQAASLALEVVYGYHQDWLCTYFYTH